MYSSVVWYNIALCSVIMLRSRFSLLKVTVKTFHLPFIKFFKKIFSIDKDEIDLWGGMPDT